MKSEFKGATKAALKKAGIDDEILEGVLSDIAGGLGDLAGKIIRIGCMGHTARPRNVAALLGALGDVLK